MTQPRWAHLLTVARTARSHGVPVTVLLGHREPGGKWNERDTIMALALQKYEDGVHSCGVHSSIGFGDENVGRVTWKETICHACEEAENARQGDKNPYPGKIWYPVWDQD